MEYKHADYDLAQMQSLPLSAKINMTKRRIKEWYDYWDGNVYISFSGGKDSTVLKHIIDSIYDDVPALFINTGLEYPEIQKFVTDIKNNKFDCFNSNIEVYLPKMRFNEVLKKYGYPIISKEVAHKVRDAKNAKAKGNEANSSAWQQLNGCYLTKNGKTSLYNCKKWRFLIDAPFKISHQCCDVMKKNPAKKYSKLTGRKPFIGTLAEESMLRIQKWKQYGCNAFNKKDPSSTPLSFWTEQDILQYLQDYQVPYCSVYGDIVECETEDGTTKLKTTGCERTGCMFCMFGCHMEKTPNRFERLYKTHPKQYNYCINGGEMVDGVWQPNKEGLGIGKVLDFINIWHPHSNINSDSLDKTNTIAVIDADLISRKKHRFPNLACMKISGYYKEKGYKVHLKLDYDNLESYEKVFISKVFTDTPVDDKILQLDNVEYGGTGFYYDKAPKLPPEIEHHMPDYHLYDEWVQSRLELGDKRKDYEYYLDYSIGFATRGCFRKCDFCVNKNYNKVEVHSPIKEFYDPYRKYICLLDDNILGCSQWKEIFKELQEINKPFQFKQGMDERILTDEKCEMLAKSKYKGSYIFAFDNIADKDIIIKNSQLIRKYFKTKSHNIMFYVLCGFDRQGKYDEEFWIQDIKDTFERIFILSKFNFKPYIMRYEKYKESPYYGAYVNIAQWCNQPSFFFNYSLKDFCIKYDDNKGGKRTTASWKYLTQLEDLGFNEEISIKPKDLVINYWNED